MAPTPPVVSAELAPRRSLALPLLVVAGVAAVAVAVLGAGGVVPLLLVAGGAVLTVLVVRRSVDVAILLGLFLLYGNVTVAVFRHVGLGGGLGGAVPLALIGIAVLYRWAATGVALRLPLLTVMLLIVGSNLVASIRAPWPGSGPEALVASATFIVEGAFLVLLIANAIRTHRMLHLAAWSITLAAGGLGALSAYQALTGRYDQTFFGLATVNEVIWQDGRFTGVPRLGGSIGEKNFYALVLLAALPFAVYLLSRRLTPPARALAAACAVTTTIGIGATYSRGALVAAALCLAGFAIVGFVPRRFLIAVVVAGVVLLATNPELGRRLGDLTDVAAVGSSAEGPAAGSTDLAIEGRYASLIAAWETFLEHPVIGVGPEQEKYFYLGVADRIGVYIHDEPREAHNLLLSVAAAEGLVGLALHGTFMALVLRGALGQRRRCYADPDRRAQGTAVVASLTVTLVGSLFLPLSYLRYLYIPVGLCVAYALLDDRGGPFRRRQGERGVGAGEPAPPARARRPVGAVTGAP